MRPFGIYKRSNGVFYGYINNPTTGTRLPAKSTGTKNRTEAEFIVMGWLRDGTYLDQPLQQAITVDTAITAIRSVEWRRTDVKRLIEAMQSRGLIDFARVVGNGPESEPLIPFLEKFWSWTSSPYVKERLAFGFSCHRRHINDNLSRIKNHWKEYFTEPITLGEIKRSHLEEFQLHLKEKGLANKSINHVVNAGRLSLSWAAKKGMIPADPSEGLQQFSQKGERREILTPTQLEALFKSEHWKSPIARTAALLSATTGMRLGEIRAVRIMDVKLDRIMVNHSYSRGDGLKSTKNGDPRAVPLLPKVRKAILDLIEINPHGSKPENFVFFSTFSKNGTGPVGENTVNSNLKYVLEKMEIDTSRLSFHSLRHGFSTSLSSQVGIEALQSVIGHRDRVMTEHYSSHFLESNFTTVQEAAAKIFKGVTA